MKLTKNNLKKVIEEEYKLFLKEADIDIGSVDIPTDERAMQMKIDSLLKKLLPADREKIKKALDSGASINSLRQQMGQNQAVDYILVQIGKLTGKLEEDRRDALDRNEVRIPGHKINGRNVYYVKYKNDEGKVDERDAGLVALTRESEPLSIEKQRKHCRDRAKNERVHFSEETKRCEYDYLDNPDDPRNLQENLKRMKITREQLKYIIKEEIDKTIEEMFGSGRDGPTHPAAYAAQRRNQRPGPHPGGATAGARQRCAEKGGYFDQSKSARGICIDRKTGREIKEEQLEEAEDSASIRKKLRDLESKANKTDSDYNRIADLEKKLNAKLGKRTRSQGVAYNPYDYEE